MPIMLLIKLFIIFLMIFIAYNLFAGLYYILKIKDQPRKAAKALTWRVGLSLLLFIMLLAAFFFGGLYPAIVIFPKG